MRMLIHKLKMRFSAFQQFDNQMDVGEHFMNVFLLLSWFFLIEQLILSFFGTFFNMIATLACFIIATILLFWIDFPKYTHKIKYYLFGTLYISVIIWWFSGAGLVGPMPNYMALLVFMFTIIFEGKVQKYALGSIVLLFITLSIVEFFKPEWITDYDTNVKKGDILSAMLYVSFIIIFSFQYIKNAYQAKQKEITKQYEASQQLNEELDNFVYRTSHDLRAPILSCMGLISLMKNNPNPEEIQYYLSLQEKSLEKMDTFIAEVLNYSRNKHHAILQETIQFEALYEDILQQNTHTAAAQRIHFSFENLLSYPFYGDNLRLKMIFHNMINNAIRYQDTDKPDSFLKIKVQATENQCVITFEDNGIGISEQSMPRIFDMFYRGTEKAEGSGFGLYMVKQAIEKLAGSVDCESILGKGTKFTVKLPFVIEKPKLNMPETKN